ncbi:hypothetical protein KCP78_01595 [Salmonella enterica subsp. enterica]|nr:hypothetical protein KCP78_01595 [Salmonella enterica subsp. enterica]
MSANGFTVQSDLISGRIKDGTADSRGVEKIGYQSGRRDSREEMKTCYCATRR